MTGGTSHIRKNYLIPTHERKHTPENRKNDYHIPSRMIFTKSTKRQGTIKDEKQSRPRENVRRLYGREWYSGYGRFRTGGNYSGYGVKNSRGICRSRNEKGLRDRGGVEKVRGDL